MVPGGGEVKTYIVTWKIDMETDTPEEAAARALICQRDPQSTATVFEVTDKDTGETVTVDIPALNWEG